MFPSGVCQMKALLLLVALTLGVGCSNCCKDCDKDSPCESDNTVGAGCGCSPTCTCSPSCRCKT
jgi:hypothetical protein